MQLAQPSWELTSRVLSDLGYEEKFTGYLLIDTGVMPRHLFSFEEVVDLLNTGKVEDFTREDLLFPGRKAALAWIDLKALIEWLNTVFGDWELALAIRQTMILAGQVSYPEKIKPIRELMETRLAQCKSVNLQATRSAC